MKPFKTSSADGLAAFAPPLTDYVNQIYLDGTNAVTVSWPNTSGFCILNSSNDYWVRSDGSAATVPTGTSSVTNGTGSAYNPSQRSRGYINGNPDASFSIISNVAGFVSIEFYSTSVV